MPVLHQAITQRELGLLYMLSDREHVNRLLTLDASPEVLRAVLLSSFQQLASEKNVNFRPNARQLKSDPKAHTSSGEPVSPEFNYVDWLIWFADQRRVKPKKAKKISVPKQKALPPLVRQPIPPAVLQPNPAAPLGYRVIVVNGKQFIERIE
jgi:hypothetical protein